jgi:hypothetical protein
VPFTPVAIRASSAAEINRLLIDLASDRPARREAAVARLTVIGSRAVARVRNLAEDRAASADARAAAFRTLEAIADPQALEPALRAAFDPEEAVALAAIGVTRVFLKTPRGVAVVDRLTEIATDRQRAVRRRLAAIDALRTALEPSTLEPLVAALRADPTTEVASIIGGKRARPASGADVQVTEAAAGQWNTDAATLRRALAHLPADFSLSTLQHLIERLREREGQEVAASAARAEWTAARGAAHAALARHGSRLALYDLREALESDASLPVEFLTALSAVGDASCLASIAAAYARPGGSPTDWWHRHLVDAFRAIVTREQITRRHAAAKKVKTRWPETFAALWPRSASAVRD